MKNRNLIIFLLILTILILVNQFYVEKIFEEKIVKIQLTKIVDVEKEKLFQTMADLENYPIIFPDNYVSVNILNRTGAITFTKETVKEAGIETTLTIKHIIEPNKKHMIEILDGDARGSVISVSFEGDKISTTITTDVEIHLNGILIPFYYLPKSNLESATNTIITTFVDYTKNNMV